MQTVRYSAPKLALSIAAGVAMLAFSFILLDSERGKNQFAGVLFLVIGPLLTLGCLKLLLTTEHALQFDHNMLEIQTMWRKRTVAWQDVASVGINTVNTHAFFGLIKTGSSRSLEIKVAGGLFGSTSLSLSRTFLDISESEFVALPSAMEAVRSGAPVPQSPARMAAQPRREAVDYRPTEEQEAFDPDAALARYLARKSQAGAEQDIHPAPMLNGAPMPRSAGTSPRPSFGRKGVEA